MLIAAALLWARRRRGGEQAEAPGWAFRRRTAWLYLIVFLAVPTPGGSFYPAGENVQAAGGIVSGVMTVTAAVFVYRDRRQRSERARWWVLAILLLGPLAFLIYSYRRRAKIRRAATLGALGEARREDAGRASDADRSAPPPPDE